MAYFTESQLRDHATRLKYASTTFSNIKTFSSQAQTTIFLSHSSKDRELAQGLVYYLGSLGITVYVDWNDSDMPRVTNRETAEKLKGKIKDNRLFMILATKNALESKWVPWEVGIADQCKGEQSMVLVPVADSSGRFEGNEYLQLYQRLEESLGSFQVIRPGRYAGDALGGFIKALAMKL